MKTFRYFLASLAFLVIGAGVAVAASYDDALAAQQNATWVSRSVTTNTSVAIRVRCLRPISSGATITVTNATTGTTFVFTSDGTNADTDVNGTGTISATLTTTATVAWVCDTINNSKYWRAIAQDLRPSTTIGAALVTVSATTSGIYSTDGLGLCYQTAVVGKTSACIGPEALASGPSGWNEPQLVNRISNPANTNLSKRVYNNWKYVTANGTYSSGAINLSIWQVYVPSRGSLKRPGESVPDYAKAVETALYGPVAGAATTVAFPLSYSTLGDIRSNAGWQMIVEYAATVPTALSVGTMSVNGQTWYAN